MSCQWQAYLQILPVWMRQEVDFLGKERLQELRLRLGRPPELILSTGHQRLKDPVEKTDLDYVVNMASRFSPWAAATISEGYITAQGGHRIGISGQVVLVNGKITGFSSVSGLCLRVARDFPGIAGPLGGYKGSLLLIGRPGSGKTTLLRDLIRQRSEGAGQAVTVVDERREIFPAHGGRTAFDMGEHVDVLSGIGKPEGILAAIRNLTPNVIALDEITDPEDCKALLHAGWCGVELLATAHAASVEDLKHRKIYIPLVESGIFDYAVIIGRDKRYRVERMDK